MSQLPNSGRIDGVSRRRGFAAPRIGVTETLAQPGATALPEVESSGARMARELFTTLGLVSQTVGEAGQLASQERHFDAVTEAEAARKQATEDALFDSQAVDTINANTPQLEQDFADRKITVPDGMKAIDFANEYVDARVAGMPQAYADSYRRHGVPRIVRIALAQQEKDKAVATADNLDLLGRRAGVVTGVPEANALIDAAVDLAPNVPRDKVLGDVAGRGILIAARAGDTEGVRIWTEALGDQLPETVRDAKNILAAKANADENATEQNAADAADRAMSSYKLGEITVEAARATLMQARPYMKPSTFDTKLDEFGRMAEKQQELVAKAELAVKEKGVMARHLNTLGTAGLNGNLWAQPALKAEITSRDGTQTKTVSMTQEEGVQRIVSDRLAKIANGEPRYAGLSPEQRGEMVAFVANNDVVPTQWKGLASAAGAAATSLTTTKDGKNVPPPPQVIDGYSLFKDLKANSTMVPKVFDDKTTMLFNIALTHQQMSGLSPEQAISTAVLAMQSPAFRNIDDRAVYKTAIEVVNTDGWFGDTPGRNPGIVAALIQERATALMAFGGFDSATAVEKVASDVRASGVTINGFWMPIESMGLSADTREAFPVIADHIIDDYIKNDPDGQHDYKGNRDMLTLRPNSLNGTWTLIDGNAQYVVKGETKRVVFTRDDIDRLRHDSAMDAVIKESFSRRFPTDPFTGAGEKRYRDYSPAPQPTAPMLLGPVTPSRMERKK